MVELKTPRGQEGLLEARVAQQLAEHPGPAAVLSFNPDALAWMAAHAPNIARGLNASKRQQLEAAERACADFLSVRLDLTGAEALQAWRRMGEAVAWTCRTPADYARVKSLVEAVMFEGFDP